MHEWRLCSTFSFLDSVFLQSLASFSRVSLLVCPGSHSWRISWRCLYLDFSCIYLLNTSLWVWNTLEFSFNLAQAVFEILLSSTSSNFTKSSKKCFYLNHEFLMSAVIQLQSSGLQRQFFIVMGKLMDMLITAEVHSTLPPDCWPCVSGLTAHLSGSCSLWQHTHW